jgi:hypothetical protein
VPWLARKLSLLLSREMRVMPPKLPKTVSDGALSAHYRRNVPGHSRPPSPRCPPQMQQGSSESIFMLESQLAELIYEASPLFQSAKPGLPSSTYADAKATYDRLLAYRLGASERLFTNGTLIPSVLFFE